MDINEAELKEKLHKLLYQYDFVKGDNSVDHFPEVVNSLLDLYRESEQLARLDELRRVQKFSVMNSKRERGLDFSLYRTLRIRELKLSNTHKTGRTE